jgi:predicted CXXCH cytochrome family protein
MGTLLLTRTAAAQPASLQPESARGCAICHLSWVDAFKRPGATPLLPKPPESIVSEGETCLGCHDGSVADDRRRVWVEHGHRTGVAPPPTMKVPAQLPLQDGKLACRTCHTAHSGAGAETLASTFFLRMRNEASQLCIACHPEQTKGPGLGTHPIGGMPFPVPDALLAAGAKAGPDKSRLICQTCHTPHGSSQSDLLVMGATSGQLCLTCHQKLRPGLWRPDMGREHPQSPPLEDDAQRQAIKDMGTKTGPGETLVCFSCHKLHHGLSGRYMLADTLRDSHLCIRCHPGRSSMFGTRHDLRVSAPAERNRLGQTPVESGPCGACHSFHQFARRPDPTKLDPTGLCATCHQAGAAAQHATGLPFSHPADIHEDQIPASSKLSLYPRPDNPKQRLLACLTCHNPHQTDNTHFLRAKPDGVCANCHGDKLAELPPAHDFTQHAGVQNGKGRTGEQTGKCGFCHGVHDALGAALWVATPQPPEKFGDLCLQCHQKGGLAGDVIPRELRHPAGPNVRPATSASALVTAKPNAEAGSERVSTQPSDAAARAALPLFDATGHRTPKGFLVCGTCHDPHGGAKGSKDMLRLAEAPEQAGLCAQCHLQGHTVAGSLHNEQLLAEHYGDTRYCAPCHAPHAKPGMAAGGMWAAPLGPANVAQASPECTGCHSPSGGGPVITPTLHPGVPMRNVTAQGTPGYLPLSEGAGGQINCRTCHLPHGSPPSTAPAESFSVEQLRGRRPMLRPFAAPNLCTTCHGFDGMRRFLYYHDPSKRGGESNEGKP